MQIPEIVDIATRIIANLGFPIFVALWLMIRTDALLQDLRIAIDDLNDTIKTLTENGDEEESV